jgi:fatty-acyl-CoA synthase
MTETVGTIGALLGDQLRRFAQREALVHVERGVRWTYAQLAQECDRFARGLIVLGVGKGDHVGIWATNSPEWVIAQLATAQIGAVLVTVNPSFRPHELEYLLRQSDARVLILIERFKTSDYVSMLLQVAPELRQCGPGELRSAKFPSLGHVVLIPTSDPEDQPEATLDTPVGMWRWEQVQELGDSISQTGLVECRARCHSDDVINIQYTSGTTGNPKGVMLTHCNLLDNCAGIAAGLELDYRDRLCIPVPLYHCFGCVLGTLLCLTRGATMVFPSQYFDPLKTLEAIEQERCTVLHGVPTMFIAELGVPEFDRFDLTSLRTGIMGGAPCPVELMKQVIERMGLQGITIAYGQTEAAPIITMTSIDDPLERRINTVGRPLSGVEVKIVDPGSGRQLGPGQQGEFWARSTMNMKGYYRMPQASLEALDDQGWLHTGDLATRDGDGYCRITGRLKDMIIRGGQNIYPREIEEFLYTNPKVAEAQVFGVPDPRLGEQVMAWIMLKQGVNSTPEEIQAFCRDSIAHYKIPRYVKFVDDFPMTVTGKVQKFRMRELSMLELHLGGKG